MFSRSSKGRLGSEGRGVVKIRHTLEITLLRGRNFYVSGGGADANGSVVFQLSDSQQSYFQSKTKCHTNTPQWNESFTFSVSLKDERAVSLEVSLWHTPDDSDDSNPEEETDDTFISLGKFNVPLYEVQYGKSDPITYTAELNTSESSSSSSSKSSNQTKLPQIDIILDLKKKTASSPNGSDIQNQRRSSLANDVEELDEEDVRRLLGTKSNSASSILKDHNPLFNSHPYKVYYSLLAGMARAEFNDGDRPAQLFPVYSIELHHIQEIFAEQYQGWNKKYDKAAKIFAETKSGSALRRMIHLQHNHLYNDNLPRGIASKTSSGYLNSGQKLLELIKFGKRNGRCRLFTYIINDHYFKFSETGASFFKDFTSKHAMHSNAAERVRFAGEFMVVDKTKVISSPSSLTEIEKMKKQNSFRGQWKLVLDNNSGTYAPSKDLLPLLQKLFTTEFNDLEVETVSIDTEPFKFYRTLLD